MLITYEPNSDVLTITMNATLIAQTQLQGAVSVGFDASGGVATVSIPDASTTLWEHGGQINVMLPQIQTTQTVVTQVVEQPVVPVAQTVVTRVIE